MQILGFILLIILIVFIVGVSLIRQVFKILFGFGRKNPTNNKYDQDATYNGDQSQQKKHEKIIPKDEGECIDFEEIKDDDKK